MRSHLLGLLCIFFTEDALHIPVAIGTPSFSASALHGNEFEKSSCSVSNPNPKVGVKRVVKLNVSHFGGTRKRITRSQRKKIRSNKHHQQIIMASELSALLLSSSKNTTKRSRSSNHLAIDQHQQEQQQQPRRCSFPLTAMECAAAAAAEDQGATITTLLPSKLLTALPPTQILHRHSSAHRPLSDNVDTRDVPPVTVPIHQQQNQHQNLVGPSRVRLPPNTALLRPHKQTATVAFTDSVQQQQPRPRLTLSAFRRPEHTVRLTKSDPTRVLETEYHLQTPGCGILGHGAFSTVRLARRKSDGTKVAIKSIAKHEALRARRLRLGRGQGHSGNQRHRHMDEWEILQTMERQTQNKHIVTLLDLFETDEKIHLVTEYCAGGELFDAIQKKRSRSPAVRRGHYSEPQAANITRQLLSALRDLHGAGIMHRDVKPENIVLVSEDDANIHAKFCDFGSARVFDKDGGGASSDAETPPSTPGRKHSFCAISCDYYAAPEVCAVGSAHKPSADVYSLGVTLYILLCGFPPVLSGGFSGDEEDNVLFPKVQWGAISEQAKALIRKMLLADPNKRITAREALQDIWICQHHVVRASTPVAPKKRASSQRKSFTVKPVGETLASAASTAKQQQLPDQSGKCEGDDDIIRSRLFQALARLQDEPSSASKKRKDSDVMVTPRRKRRRGSMDCPRSRRGSMDFQRSRRCSIDFQRIRRGSIDFQPRTPVAMKELYCDMSGVAALAMKELYCDVSAVASVATAAAAGVVSDKSDVHVYNTDISAFQESNEDGSPSPLDSAPQVTLSA